MELLLGSVGQTTPPPIAVLGTVSLLALFLSGTAHLAARNVLGDVPASKALAVGLGPALISVGTELLSLPGGLGVLLALVVDGGAIHLLYGQPRRMSAYITFIHVIITILLGSVLIGGLIVLSSLPG